MIYDAQSRRVVEALGSVSPHPASQGAPHPHCCMAQAATLPTPPPRAAPPRHESLIVTPAFSSAALYRPAPSPHVGLASPSTPFSFYCSGPCLAPPQHFAGTPLRTPRAYDQHRRLLDLPAQPLYLCCLRSSAAPTALSAATVLKFDSVDARVPGAGLELGGERRASPPPGARGARAWRGGRGGIQTPALPGARSRRPRCMLAEI